MNKDYFPFESSQEYERTFTLTIRAGITERGNNGWTRDIEEWAQIHPPDEPCTKPKKTLSSLLSKFLYFALK